jgi:hypothetical protein
LSEYALHGTSGSGGAEKEVAGTCRHKAKRLKGLRENPDFIEAVQEERLVAQRYSDDYDRVYVFAQKMIETYNACLGERESTVELKNEYIDELKANKVLIDAIQGYKRLIAVQEETIGTLRVTIKVHDEMLELNKKERNPNRVTGGKRGRPKGSKSKAVSFAADAMPAVMTWCLSVREQKWQQH